MLDTGYLGSGHWLNICQILEDLVPVFRLEGEIHAGNIEYWIFIWAA